MKLRELVSVFLKENISEFQHLPRKKLFWQVTSKFSWKVSIPFLMKFAAEKSKYNEL